MRQREQGIGLAGHEEQMVFVTCLPLCSAGKQQGLTIRTKEVTRLEKLRQNTNAPRTTYYRRAIRTRLVAQGDNWSVDKLLQPAASNAVAFITLLLHGNTEST